MTALVIDRIGSLVTNDPGLGQGPLGLIAGASVVIEDGFVIEVGPAGAIADERIDAEGACVLPGFVDSHTHLVFAGDRAAEFSADGRPTVRRWRHRGDHRGDARREHRRTRSPHVAARRRARRHGTTTLEIKSGYGLDVANEVRALDVAGRHTAETTFLGAHLVPTEYAGRADDYIHLVCNEMLAAAASRARWIDAFCETGAFDADQCRAVLDAGRAAGLGLRLHGNQLGHGPGVQLAVECGCASVDHCTYLSDADIAALAASDTVATFLPAADFSTRQPYPDARRAIDAGVSVAIASNCNPGSSYTTSIPFCIALAVRDMHMTIDEAVQAATVGGARALRRNDVGRLSPGSTWDTRSCSMPHRIIIWPIAPACSWCARSSPDASGHARRIAENAVAVGTSAK